MAYTAKTISGAQRRVRELEKRQVGTQHLLQQFAEELILLAKLAATGPAFDNPLIIARAQNIRDRILRTECNLNPDGSFIDDTVARNTGSTGNRGCYP